MTKAQSRITLLEREAMSDAQRRVHDEVAAGPRGRVRGPLLLWLHSPEYASRVQQVGAFLRWETVFEGRLSELAILITARHYTSHYVWFVHSAMAIDKGLAPEILDSLKHRRRPDFVNEDEEIVYDFCTELLTTHRVSDAALGRVKDKFGERGAIELGAIIAHYHLGAITLAVADLGLPDGTRTCLPE